MKKILLLSLISIYFLCHVICTNAGTIDPKANDKDHISYGEKHECVVQLCGETSDDKKYIASAVILQPRWVITAAHVINNTKTRKIIVKDKNIDIIKTYIPRDFNINTFGKMDIALCYLEEEVALSYYPQLYNSLDEVGKVCSQAGYGVTGNFITGAIISDYKKRAGSNIIDGIEKDMLVCSINKGKKTSMEFLIAWGDSGGGLFIDQKLAGIHSCIFRDSGQPKGTYQDSSGHTRISVFKDWIEKTINTHNSH